MASRSTTRESELAEYQNGWAALTELMDAGSSWSGNERNSSFVNVGDGTFCDVSALSGLDFLDDGRCVATTDWDRDGRLDLWLRNRTGPQLRLLRNRGSAEHHFVALRLVGVDCNRDAIGARVTASVAGAPAGGVGADGDGGPGERRLVQTLRAGSGYLAQSSKWITLGLGSATRVERLQVTWPDGSQQEFEEIEVDRFYRLEQGASALEVVPAGRARLRPAPLESPAPGSARVVLRAPLPIPPDVWVELFGEPDEPGAAWIQLWAQWCAPCLAEMDELVERWSDLRAAGLRLVALSVDEAEDRARARSVFEERVRARVDDPRFGYSEGSPALRAFLEVLLEHVLGRSDEGSLPTGLLIDRYGYLELVVLGPVDVEQLASDVASFGMAPEGIATRAPFPGRWFYGMPRNLPGLIEALEERGLRSAATFYEGLLARESFRER